jgi:hypothetical protein
MAVLSKPIFDPKLAVSLRMLARLQSAIRFLFRPIPERTLHNKTLLSHLPMPVLI